MLFICRDQFACVLGKIGTTTTELIALFIRHANRPHDYYAQSFICSFRFSVSVQFFFSFASSSSFRLSLGVSNHTEFGIYIILAGGFVSKQAKFRIELNDIFVVFTMEESFMEVNASERCVCRVVS